MPILSKILNQPLMIEPKRLDAMIEQDFKGIEKDAKTYYTEKKRYATYKNKAIIKILGPLSQRLDFWSWLFGGVSYDSIRQDFHAALADSDIDTIIFEIDSPGGQVAGVFDLVDEISAARGQKKVIAMVNEMAYSAAYAIAAATDEVYVPRTGGVGSIGVIAIHADLSKWEEKVGVKYTAIYAGARKNDFTPHEPLSNEAYKTVKAEIDDIYDIFVGTVAKNRMLDEQAIRNMEAGIYQGKKSVEIGLADGIRTMQEILTNQGGRTMSKSLVEALSAAMEGAKPKDLAKSMAELGYVEKEGMITEEAHAKAIREQAEEATKRSDEAVKAAKEEGREEARNEATSVLELCSVAGVDNIGLKLVSEGVTKEEAKKKIMEAKATGPTINSAVHPLHFGEENPLIADAKRRAKEANA